MKKKKKEISGLRKFETGLVVSNWSTKWRPGRMMTTERQSRSHLGESVAAILVGGKKGGGIYVPKGISFT